MIKAFIKHGWILNSGILWGILLPSLFLGTLLMSIDIFVTTSMAELTFVGNIYGCWEKSFPLHCSPKK